MATVLPTLRSESANCLNCKENHEKQQTSFTYEIVNGQEVCVIHIPYQDAWMEGKTFMPWLSKKKTFKATMVKTQIGIELIICSDSGIRLVKK